MHVVLLRMHETLDQATLAQGYSTKGEVVRKIGVIAIAAGMLLAFVAVGCGGDDDGGGTTVKAFTRQANAICSKNNVVAHEKVLKAFEDPQFAKVKPGPAAIQLEVEVALPPIVAEAEALVREIGALEVPDEKQSEVETLLATYETWIEKTETSPDKVVAENDLFNDARELAGKYGLARCAESLLETPVKG